jgi:hypothetical protein
MDQQKSDQGAVQQQRHEQWNRYPSALGHPRTRLLARRVFGDQSH